MQENCRDPSAMRTPDQEETRRPSHLQKLCILVAGCYALGDGSCRATRPDRSIATVSRHPRPDLPADAELELVLRASEAPSYNTAAVARRCGMPAATFQAWERRHGFPAPGRGPGKQRLYSERDVQALRWLQARIAEGLTISTALALLRASLGASPVPVTPIRRTDQSTRALASRLQGALLAFDGARAGAVLGEAFGLYPVEQVCLEVIQPMLDGVGRGWHTGAVDIAQEHFASGYIRQRLAALLDLSNGADRPRTVVAACAPDDWHELGLLMVALFLARRGWHVLYLGASLPPDGLERRLALLRPAAIVFSASTAQTATALAAITRRLAELPTPQPLVGYGGQAFEHDPTLHDAALGLYLGPDAATAVTRLEHALSDADRSAPIVPSSHDHQRGTRH
jgi:methanogenic corrinoid protein MtbC1